MTMIVASIDAAELLDRTVQVQGIARTLRLLHGTMQDHPEGATAALRAMAEKAEAIGVWLEGLRPAS